MVAKLVVRKGADIKLSGQRNFWQKLFYMSSVVADWGTVAWISPKVKKLSESSKNLNYNKIIFAANKLHGHIKIRVEMKKKIPTLYSRGMVSTMWWSTTLCSGNGSSGFTSSTPLLGEYVRIKKQVGSHDPSEVPTNSELASSRCTCRSIAHRGNIGTGFGSWEPLSRTIHT